MSALNCKPGDLAVIVRSSAGNEGKIVRCIELSLSMSWVRPDGSSWTAPGWRVDQMLRGANGSADDWIEDSLLRPLRDPGEDARDETLSWKRVPISSTTKDAEVSNG